MVVRSNGRDKYQHAVPEGISALAVICLPSRSTSVGSACCDHGRFLLFVHFLFFCSCQGVRVVRLRDGALRQEGVTSLLPPSGMLLCQKLRQ